MTLLVVEDDPEVRKVVCLTLQLQGFHVLSADSGSQAEVVSEQYSGPIALLLTDVVLPGLSGPGLFQKLKARRTDLKVLYISGYPEDVLLEHRVDGGSASFLPKPFSSAALGEKVRQILL